MKVKYILFLLFFYFVNFGFSQNHLKKISKKNSGGIYKKKLKNEKLKSNQEFIIIKDGDTLIKTSISREDVYQRRVPYEKISSPLLEIYKDVVYKKSDSAYSNKTKMQLWTEPIKIFIDNSVNSFYIEELYKVCQKLNSTVDSLSISLTKQKEKSNFFIYQIDSSNQKKANKLFKNNQFIKSIVNRKNNKIRAGMIEINLSKHKKVDKHIVTNNVIREFIRSLGLYYPSSTIDSKNMLSKTWKSRYNISPQDYKLIKYHYSYGICKFTSLSKFEENHKKAKNMLKKHRKYYFIHPLRY